MLDLLTPTFWLGIFDDIWQNFRPKTVSDQTPNSKRLSLLALDIVPDEIWLNIFDNIAQHNRHLPETTLINASLTCRAFRVFSVPLIYRSLVYHPYVVNGSAGKHWSRPNWCPLSQEQVDHQIQRLAFYSSDSISGHVQQIELSAKFDENSQIVTEETSGRIDSLVHRFYDFVLRFTNAQSILLFYTDVDTFGLQQLSQLPNLREMRLHGCNLILPVTANLPRLRLRAFWFWHMAKSEELAELGVARWLALLDPDRLEYIRVAPARTSTEFFRHIPSMGPFDLLTTLGIDVKSAQMLMRMPLLLDKTPSVRHVQFSLFGCVSSAVAKQIAHDLKPFLLPTLQVEEYRGPCELLPMVLGSCSKPPPLRRLDIDTLQLDGEPFSVCLQILSLPVCSAQIINVVSFSAGLKSIEIEDLERLCALLPNLLDLSLDTVGDRLRLQIVTSKTFLDEIVELPLPSRIRSLSIDWTAGAFQDVKAKHMQVRAQLVGRFPSLERLWFCDWQKSAYLWHRTASGRELSTVCKTGTDEKNEQALDEYFVVFPTPNSHKGHHDLF
ncbi:hypothetical protein GALMADRAFT_277202 [Galerina marginata CBS 339.88]|uniref:F-box domain-containing protein n=1 Tax=Galerina marginata (strain CBS 339.88) TaxID=685588 RepID=A0A067T9F3_GALM3|nr:hypothetical protein GALMADRAFT_277202 [Galerina marginata CBS 339.88]